MTDRSDDAVRDDRPVAPLLTLAEASALTGRPAEAIRTMIRRRKLVARKGNDGRWLVEIPAEMHRPGGQTGTDRDTAGDQVADGGQDIDDRAAKPSLQEVTDWLTGLRVTAAELRLETDYWRSHAEQQTLARATAEARLEAAERAHAAELAALRHQIDSEVMARNAVIEELRAMLVDARRPWWRRWLGLVLLLATMSVPQLAGAAESRMCGVRGSTIEEAFAKCRSGDTIFTAVPNMRDASLLAARVCDFGQGMLVERQGEKPEDGAILACVYAGRVRSLAE
jgi:hypothetical protein